MPDWSACHLIRSPRSQLQVQPNEMNLLRHHQSNTLPVPRPPRFFPSHGYNHHHLLLPIPTRLRAYYHSSSSSTAEPAVSVYSVLRSHDIPDDACKALLSKFPDFFLKIKPLETLHPKLQFLRSAGLSGLDIADVLLSRPRLLHYSLHPSLSSSVTFLASVLPSREDLVRALKSISCPRTDLMEANLQSLRHRHVPESVILKLLFQHPRSLTSSTEKFVAALETVQELGLSPTCKPFPVAVDVVSFMSKENFSGKVELFKDLGWSDEQISSAFRMVPRFFTNSDATIRNNIEYFNEVVGWGPEVLSLIPSVIMRSVEKTIAPRCAVLNLLLTKGLLRTRSSRRASEFSVYYSYQRKLLMKEKSFFKNYVDKYKEVLPEVVEAYRGEIEFTGWGRLEDEQAARLQALYDRGVTEGAVLKLLLQRPRSLTSSAEGLFAALADFDDELSQLASYTSKEGLPGKVELLKELGWSEEQVFSMFRRKPKNLSISDELLRTKVEFFKEVLGWGPELLCSDPSIMQMSLKERILPRCAVLNMLMMKGLLEKKTWCPSKFRENEKSFFANYVEEYKEEVPEVLEAYQRKIDFVGWGWLKDVQEALAPKS